MSKSIESLWQNGFVDDMALNAPKLNNLYKQESQNLIDKFESLFAANHKGVIYGAITICIVLSIFGAPVLGGLIALMLCGLIYIGKKQLKELEKVDKTANSFVYLQAFDIWLDNAITQYTKIYRVFYPTLFALCSVRFMYSETGSGALAEFNLINDGQISLLVYVAICVIAIIISMLAGVIYRADVNLVYGHEIKKLKQLIADMREIQ